MSRWIVACLPLFGGCAIETALSDMGARESSDWYESGKVEKSREDIARTVRDLMTRQGYQAPDFDASSPKIVSAWDTHLSTRFREGIRTMIEAEILPVESGGFNVRIRSTMEVNDNDNQCNIAERAKWIPAGAVDKWKPHIPEPAMRLITMIRYRFFGMTQ